MSESIRYWFCWAVMASAAFEDGEVAVCAGDFFGGGLGLFGANRFHFLVGEAVEGRSLP